MQKLELTWIGKNEEIKVEPRILLHDPSKDYGDKNTDNILIHGDNLLALKALESKYAGLIKCIYIDPPYNTGEAFEEYNDNLEHSIWLGLMYERLKCLKALLAPDGTIFVQLNDDEMNYCKVIMDEIFGRSNFVNIISVKTKNSSGASGGGEDRKLKKNIEYILCYGGEEFKKFNPSFTKKELSDYLDEMRKSGKSFKYTSVLTDIGDREFVKTIKDGSGQDIKVYRHSSYKTCGIKQLSKEADISEIDAFNKYFEQVYTTENAQTSIRTRVQEAMPGFDGLISIDYYPVSGRNKGKLTTVYFVGENKRLVSFFKNVCTRERGYIYKKEKVGSLWDDLNWNNVNREGGVTFSGGKKPEVLLQRILELATNEGDLVLDSFLGSGTTAAVATKMNRKWIGVELGDHAYSLCKPRLNRVIDGEDHNGISQDVEWNGGSGYKFYELAPSLITTDSYGNKIIDPNYNEDMLAAAVALLNGYTYAPDKEIYWKQGFSTERSFIFTTTKFITREILDSINDSVPEEINLLICSPAFEIGLNSAYQNITLKKIPQSVLDKCTYGNVDYSLPIVEKSNFTNEEEFVDD